MSPFAGVAGLAVTGPRRDRFDEVLTPRALGLVALLHRELDGRRLELLPAHQERLQALAEGGSTGSSAGTAHVREDDPRQLFWRWRCPTSTAAPFPCRPASACRD